eukprot:CAMPEP_0185532114 /NCGR_PEP_ID=MMETSP1366-20130426/107784_1 /TAXON_ID=38817 /ORGANISM="Gephyrocapsa oceanica, Strain RCC1303" /LENGTH=106 /DNA_ID=CAMNT_0028143835 /DNA_START=15 /DNA_END=335 /DNA_ORIENTATION=-
MEAKTTSASAPASSGMQAAGRDAAKTAAFKLPLPPMIAIPAVPEEVKRETFGRSSGRRAAMRANLVSRPSFTDSEPDLSVEDRAASIELGIEKNSPLEDALKREKQ